LRKATEGDNTDFYRHQVLLYQESFPGFLC
jgi:hypothetical protein